ncbi:hypothetical protein K3495_g53 [Podosphaera aphanis]|nr:hypothetical protein K3495_g53 [Podosphaera aphanis]
MASQTTPKKMHTVTPKKKAILPKPSRIDKPKTRSKRISLHPGSDKRSKLWALKNLKGSCNSRKFNEDVAKARRGKKIERRKRDKRTYTAKDWAAPAPANLNAKLDLPKVKTKYQSYFEFTENPEKKEKKLEFKGC